MLRTTLLAPTGKPDGVAALFTNGPDASAWYEHKTLAERAGLLLVQPADLQVRDGRVIHVPGGEQIDALYLRLDDELVDTVDGSGRTIGAQVFDVAAAGGVVLANAPGNGIADDKAMYPHVAGVHRLLPGRAPAAGVGADVSHRATRPNAAPCWSGSASWSPSRSTGTAGRAC